MPRLILDEPVVKKPRLIPEELTERDIERLLSSQEKPVMPKAPIYKPVAFGAELVRNIAPKLPDIGRDALNIFQKEAKPVTNMIKALPPVLGINFAKGVAKTITPETVTHPGKLFLGGLKGIGTGEGDFVEPLIKAYDIKDPDVAAGLSLIPTVLEFGVLSGTAKPFLESLTPAQLEMKALKRFDTLLENPKYGDAITKIAESKGTTPFKIHEDIRRSLHYQFQKYSYPKKFNVALGEAGRARIGRVPTPEEGDLFAKPPKIPEGAIPSLAGKIPAIPKAPVTSPKLTPDEITASLPDDKDALLKILYDKHGVNGTYYTDKSIPELKQEIAEWEMPLPTKAKVSIKKLSLPELKDIRAKETEALKNRQYPFMADFGGDNVQVLGPAHNFPPYAEGSKDYHQLMVEAPSGKKFITFSTMLKENGKPLATPTPKHLIKKTQFEEMLDKQVVKKPVSRPRTLTGEIISRGGLDPDKLAKDYNLKEVREFGLGHILKKGGEGLDVIASQLETEGLIQVPEDMNPGDYLMEQLRDRKARIIKTADQLEKEYKTEYTKWTEAKRGEGYTDEELIRAEDRAIGKGTPADLEEEARSEAFKEHAATDFPFGENLSLTDQKLQSIADELVKLSSVAPRLITLKQLAYIHVLKKKNMLSDSQFARLRNIFTGKKSLKVTTPTGKPKKAPVTQEDAKKLINALERVVPKAPLITGQPPVIPISKALVSSEWNQPFNDLTQFQAMPLSGLDPIRAAELVDGKSYGPVRKFIVEPAQEAERLHKVELKQTLDELTKISKSMKSKSKASEIAFKYIEKSLDLGESMLVDNTIRSTAEYMRKTYDELLERINENRELLGKTPIRKRHDYITHIQELSLLDEFYQGLSNVPNDAINIPPFARSNSPFFRFALQRLGGEEFKLDAIDAFETYVRKAYPVIYNTEVLKSARPLVDRLPPNAYKYFSQYLDETMALRPSKADLLVPKPILNGISWLRRQMGKGAILGNLASVFNQFFTIPNSMSAVGPKFFASAALKMTRPEWRAFTEAHSKVLQSRIFEIDFDPTLMSKVDKALGFLITYFDKEMVRVAFGAAFEKALSEGKNFQDAVRYADDLAFKTQSAFNLTDLPPAFRSKIASSFLQFQNTVNNGLNYLRFDLGKEGEERGKWGVFQAGLMWLATLLALHEIYKQFGIPTAVDEWTDVVPLISMAEYGSPVTYSLPTAILDRVIAKRPQDKLKANRALQRAIFLFLPAGNQVRKSIEGIYSVSQGGKFDRRGRLLFPITGKPEEVRAALFGSYGTKAGQAYINRGFIPEKSSRLIKDEIGDEFDRKRQELKKTNLWYSREKSKITKDHNLSYDEMDRRIEKLENEYTKKQETLLR